MQGNPIQTVLVGLLLASFCLVCILGPVAVVAAAGWIGATFGGLDPGVAVGVGIVLAVAIYGLVRYRRKPAALAEEAN